jgi:hypothetical protein
MGAQGSHVVRQIEGPLTRAADEEADRWGVTWDRAMDEAATHARIVATLTITGDEYPGQALTHAWHAVAADPRARRPLEHTPKGDPHRRVALRR